MREDFWDNALCREIGTEIFFPEKETSSSDYAAAVRICRKCEIRQKCLDYALADADLVGIWGGVGWKRRQIMRRKKKWN
jgi:WhiB family transcriptional regulator, redox-sensing transcriptional regulator